MEHLEDNRLILRGAGTGFSSEIETHRYRYTTQPLPSGAGTGFSSEIETEGIRIISNVTDPWRGNWLLI